MKKINITKWLLRISRVLIADKVPYLFTILIGVTAYQLDHFINSVSETPIIKYEFETLGSKDSAGFHVNNIKLVIKNLNKKIVFKNLEFTVRYSNLKIKNPSEIYNAELIPVHPAPMLPDSDAISWRSKFNQYRIPLLQPGGQYWAMLSIRDKNPINEMPFISLNSTDNIWLTDWNAQTLLIEYQIGISISLIAISFIVLILYASHFYPLNESSKDEKLQ
jgi:hypothetical protein